MNCLQSWPEPLVCVQSLAESGISTIPMRYIKPPSLRPVAVASGVVVADETEKQNIPIIDLESLWSSDGKVREAAMKTMSEACREWGFFHVVNHGIDSEMMERMREMWKEFFDQSLEKKKEYENSPLTYEGYGSRLGVEKGAILDWSDYFFLNFMPSSLRKPTKWPAFPSSCRKLIEEYGEEVLKLCGRLMKELSLNLGLGEEKLLEAIGGENGISACMRANLYPKCPQPDLTLGLSSHSDPGGITILLPDDNVPGLQVLKDHHWITIQPIPNALVVNIGDQIQVLSNAIYKSVEHRVIVNSAKDRVSLAFFYNPKSDMIIEPLKEFVKEERPPLYSPMTYDEYRLHIRKRGPCGKSQIESLKSI